MENTLPIPAEELAQQIYFLRGKKVMFDFDLARLYDMETRILKQQVRRNIDRFPDDFMFVLTREEWEKVITNCDNLSVYSRFKPFPPFAFTEQGVAMLSSVLRSKRAIMVNIAIMRAFVNLRKLIDANKDLIRRIDSLEEKYDKKFILVFEAIKELIREENQPREKIGYKIGGSSK
ncbi:MAG: ORF6N domain-containing protein [Bacteroidetes bacterium]|nr:ORF6N domain-containing protein [Bacteroidota bacterium]